MRTILIVTALALSGCDGCYSTSVADRCKAHGFTETAYAKHMGTVCVERRADGMGVLLLLPPEEPKP